MIKDINIQRMILNLNLDFGSKCYFLNNDIGRYMNKYCLNMLEKFVIPKEAKILNVCDGIGTLSLEMENLGYNNVIGVDSNKELINISRIRCKTSKFYYGDAYNLPFKDNSFDVITYVDCIELLESDLILKEAKRVLKNNGYIYIECFNKIIHKGLGRIPFIKRLVYTREFFNTDTYFKFVKIIKKNKLQILYFDSMIPDKQDKDKFITKLFNIVMSFNLLKKMFSPVFYFYLQKDYNES